MPSKRIFPTLSQFPAYRNARPEVAALFAETLAAILSEPETQRLLQEAGVNPNSLLDGPTTARGIADERAQQFRRRDPLLRLAKDPIGQKLQGIERGAADFLASFGLEQPLGRLVPGQEGQVRLEESPADLTTEVFGFDVEPPRIISNIGFSILPFIGGSRVASRLTRGVSNPRLRGPLILGGTFGGLETARELGGALARGEQIEPGRILREGLIGAAVGFPVGPGLGGRALSGLIAGGAATGTAAIPGQELDPTRVATEVLFSTLFPIRAELPKPAAHVGPTDMRQELLKAVDEASAAPTRELRRRVGERLSQFSEEQLLQMFREGGDEAVLGTVFSNPNRVTVEYLRARERAVAQLAELPEVALESLAKEQGLRGVFASDALAFKNLQTRPLNAPATDDLDRKIAKLTSEQQGNEIVARNAALAEVRRRTIPLGLSEFKKRPEGKQLIAQLEKSLEASRAATPDHVDIDDIVTQSILTKEPISLRGTVTDKMREILFPNRVAELKDLDVRLATVLDNLSSATEPKLISNLTAQAAQLRSARDSLAQRVNETLDATVPPRIDNAEEARRVVRQLSEFLTPKQLTQLRRELPEILSPFEKEIKGTLQAVTTRKFRQLSGEDRALANLERALRNEKVLKDVTGDIPPDELRQLGGRDTFKGMELRAKALDSRLSVDGNTFLLSRNGLTQRYRSLKEVSQALDNIAGEVLVDPLALDRAAAERGLSAVHAGDGRYLFVDHIDDVIKRVDSASAAAEEVLRVPRRADQAVELSPTLAHDVGGAVGSGRTFASEPRLPVADIEVPEFKPIPKRAPKDVEEAIRQHATEFSKFWRTTKESMLLLEETMPDIKAFSELFEPMAMASARRQNFWQGEMENLQKVFKGISRNRYNAIQEAMISPNNEAAVIEFYRLNAAERASLERLKQWYSNLLNLNPSGMRELREGMARLRTSAGDPDRAIGDFRLPRTWEPFRTAIQHGRIRPGGDNAAEVAMSTLHEMSNQRFGINKILSHGDQMVSVLNQRAVRLGRGAASTRQGQTLEAAKRALTHYLSIVGHRSDLSARAFGKEIDEVVAPVFKKLGLIDGTEVTRKDWDRLGMQLTTYISGSAMSFRAALAIRNWFQSLLPSVKVNYRIGMRNQIKAAKDNELWQLARDNGVFTDTSGLLFFDEIRQVNPGLVTQIQKLGLRPYKTMDQYNRVVAFGTGRDAIKEFAPLATTNPDAFLVKTGLAGDSSVVQNAVLRKIQAGDVEGAANFYGRHIAQDTQYIYSRANLPDWMTQGIPGKFLGQFGTWPLSFTNFMSRNLAGIAASGARGRYSRKFALQYMAQWAALAALGAALGIDTSTWNAGLLWSFEGGPVIQGLRDATDALTGGNEFQRQRGLAGLRRLGYTAVPLGGFLQDIQDANEASGELQSLLALLGFNVRR